MSKQDILRSFTRPLLRQLNKDTRKAVEAQRGQLLLLDDTDSFKRVAETVLGRKIPKALLDKALKAGKKRAKGLQDSYTRTKAGSRRLSTIQRRVSSVLRKENLVIGENAFVLAAFSSAGLVKQEIANVLIAGLGAISAKKREDLNQGIHRGHGEAGLAVSQVQLGKAFNKAAGLDLLEPLIEGFDSFIQKASISEGDKRSIRNQVLSLSTEYKHVVSASSGDLKAQYFSIVTYQAQIDNAADAILEKRLLTLFRSYISNTKTLNTILHMPGSPSIFDKIETHIVASMTDILGKNSNVKVTKRLKSKKGRVSSGSVIATEKAQKKSKGRLIRKPRKPMPRARKGAASQPLQMIALINKELPDTVAKNMGAPALVYRTGRFANSVKLIDINKTAQGFSSLGYTYQRNPYQVFEASSGSALASTDRDPRKIIEGSIRELAARFAMGRFYLRRL